MATFVHITAEKNRREVRLTGIKAGTSQSSGHYGVYAMPVIADYFVTHYWLSELKRGQRAMVGVYFRIPDDEKVWAGHFEKHELMTAAEAVAFMVAEAGDITSLGRDLYTLSGLEVLIPRSISRREVIRVRHLPPGGLHGF